MRVLVCGGRDFDNPGLLNRALTPLVACARPMNVLIHGGAPGADALAGEWAKKRHIPMLVYRAQWDIYGNKAGPIRNQRMIDQGKPQLVIAFPGGRGTADMVHRAEAAGIEVRKVGWE